MVPISGRLLVASPMLLDPNFARTVVLMLAHGDEGALGLVLNRPSDVDVGQVLPDAWRNVSPEPHVLFVGGPVGSDSVIGLARVPGEGGDGFVAINAFITARDDHVLFYAPAASFTAHPYLHDKLPYDPRDLAPVARVSATVVSLTAPPQLNVKSLGELMAMARARPGKLNWASVTGATDLVISAFLKREGLYMAKIPYRDAADGISLTATLVPTGLGRMDEDRISNLTGILDAFFSATGYHMNVNVLNRDMLLDAMDHPEKYPSLTIRVSGYAVNFVRLTRAQQTDVINRTFHGA